ncbi:MAG: MerR family transcriptional regulator [Deltaproteobacteria bacterium]|jgi:DNA-binding transcriptional MerR regulator|nr:MerR family transcriptional regulator [Deltaproteobacteria bacterium]
MSADDNQKQPETDDGQVYYKLKDLSEILAVEKHVLRYWEREFPQIEPIRIGQRRNLYTREHLRVFREIKRLLYEERYTVAGARRRLGRPDFMLPDATFGLTRVDPETLLEPAAGDEDGLLDDEAAGEEDAPDLDDGASLTLSGSPDILEGLAEADAEDDSGGLGSFSPESETAGAPRRPAAPGQTDDDDADGEGDADGNEDGGADGDGDADGNEDGDADEEDLNEDLEGVDLSGLQSRTAASEILAALGGEDGPGDEAGGHDGAPAAPPEAGEPEPAGAVREPGRTGLSGEDLAALRRGLEDIVGILTKSVL